MPNKTYFWVRYRKLLIIAMKTNWRIAFLKKTGMVLLLTAGCLNAVAKIASDSIRPSAFTPANSLKLWMGNITEIEKKSTANEGTGFFCRIPAGKTKVTHKVKKPASKDLVLKVKVNELTEVRKTIPAKSITTIEYLVNATNIKVKFQGDRPLVLLETIFN